MLRGIPQTVIRSLSTTRRLCTTASFRQLPRVLWSANTLSAQVRSNLQSSRTYCSGSTFGNNIPPEIVNLPLEEYHRHADLLLEELSDRLDEISEQLPEIISDVEFSQGVLTITVPPIGTYVINKQPPNKQIWLSSPVSGPNRFDYYDGTWISLRDNTKLLRVLHDELREVSSDVRLI